MGILGWWGAGWLEFAAEGAMEHRLEEGVKALPASGLPGVGGKSAGHERTCRIARP